MPGPKRILVILPCLNEQERIGAVVRSVRTALPDASVAVINDDSTDATAEEAAAAGATVIPHPVNLGYGAALETGYFFARANGYTLVAQMDGDGQHLADELPKIIQPVRDNRADIVLGSRHLPSGIAYPTPPARRLAQLFFSILMVPLTRQWIHDPTTGFQCLGPRALRLFASGVLPCDYPDADVVSMASMAGLRILEVPVRMRPRAGGRSMHSGLRPAYYAIKMLLSLFIVALNFKTWKRWRQTLRQPGP
jgi:glycosyltransferase involved in cell wall biosynthesis